MPNVDDEPSSVGSIERILQSIEASSVELGEKATALSKLVEQITLRLVSMPGKTFVSVKDGETTLSFARHDRSWGVWLADKDSPIENNTRRSEDLTGVSVARKARAFPLLVKLLHQIDEAHRRETKAIVDALKLNAAASKGGK
jgi:hypothetical protein